MTEYAKKYIKANIPYFTKIPRKSRYTDPLKDRAWSITSDFCRVRDFINYGCCVSCGKPVENYKCFDGGHYESMGGNGALSGFNIMNVHGECPDCNGFHNGKSVGYKFGETLKRRYGEDIIGILHAVTLQTVKADDWYFIKIIEDRYKDLQAIKRTDILFPEYI